MLLEEVLSESSSNYDRGGKSHLYRTIPSLVDYLLIEQDAMLVDLFSRRKGSDLWKIERHSSPEAAVYLPSLDFSISLRDLYEKIVFPAADK